MGYIPEDDIVRIAVKRERDDKEKMEDKEKEVLSNS